MPAAVTAKMVVDTGAALTAIDDSILQQLGLPPTGTIAIHTPSTQGVPHQTSQYDVTIILFGAQNQLLVRHFPALAVIAGQFKPQGIDGLLGRDVLAGARLHYSGFDNWYGISF